ncbi:MAG: hypothetical protein AAF724_05345 [Pseudomonadota bacterium]
MRFSMRYRAAGTLYLCLAYFVVADAAAQSPSYGADDLSGDQNPSVDQETIAEALRGPRPPGRMQIGSRGIDVPPPPPDAIYPREQDDVELSIIMRRAGEREQRMTGGPRMSLSLGANNTSDAPQLDLDITARPFEHTHQVSGRWEHQFPVKLLINISDSPMFPWKAEYTNVAQTRDIARAIVVLTDECGHYIKRETSASGSFSFDWTPVDCGTGQITVYSVTDFNKVGVGRWNNGPMENASELTNLSSDYRAYSYSRTFDTDEAAGGLDLGTITIPQDQVAARGFAIMSNMQKAMAYFDALPGISKAELPKLNVEYTVGLKPADIDCSEAGWGELLRSNFYGPGIDPGFVHIVADCGDFGYDDHAHIHEAVHYYHRFFLRMNPNYNQFGEGMANVQSALIRGQSWMTTTGSGLLENIDVNSRMACWDGTTLGNRIDRFDQHAECINDGGTPGFPFAEDWDPNLANQGWLPKIVMDLTDGASNEDQTRFIMDGQSPDSCGNSCEYGQFDGIAGNIEMLEDVLVFYLGGDAAAGENPNYEDRGLDGLDMTDLLDGFICRGHVSGAQIEAIVVTAMGLDYDASGAPDSCPHPAD